MARIAKIVNNEKKGRMVKKAAKKRAELKTIIVDPNASDEDRFEAMVKLNKMPRNSSAVRYRNRCVLTGRSRGVLSDFQLSRIKFRELAHRGIIPGVTKSSW